MCCVRGIFCFCASFFAIGMFMYISAGPSFAGNESTFVDLFFSRYVLLSLQECAFVVPITMRVCFFLSSLLYISVIFFRGIRTFVSLNMCSVFLVTVWISYLLYDLRGDDILPRRYAFSNFSRFSILSIQSFRLIDLDIFLA